MTADRHRSRTRRSGCWCLQRWVARRSWVAIVLVAGWFVVVAIGLAVYLHRRPRPAAGGLGTFVAILLGTGRDRLLDGLPRQGGRRGRRRRLGAGEPAERDAALTGDAASSDPSAGSEPGETRRAARRESFTGEDGHAGTGRCDRGQAARRRADPDLYRVRRRPRGGRRRLSDAGDERRRRPGRAGRPEGQRGRPAVRDPGRCGPRARTRRSSCTASRSRSGSRSRRWRCDARRHRSTGQFLPIWRM